MTLKSNKAPLLSNIKLYASFHHDMWIQNGVTLRKRLIWVMTSVTLTFDLWLWPFAWTSLLSLVINPENFVMIRWQEQWKRCDRQTDRETGRQTDGQKEVFVELLGRSYKKSVGPNEIPPKILQIRASSIAPFLTNMINKSINLSIYLSDFKEADLSHLSKKEDNLNKFSPN